MAYGYSDLSSAQEDAVRIMKFHNDTLTKQKGFWTWNGVEFHSYKNGTNTIICPIWYCRITTLRVLARRNIVALDETTGVCKLK